MVTFTLRVLDVRRKPPVPSTGLSLRPFVGLNIESNIKCLPVTEKKYLVLCSDNIGVSDCDIPRIHRLLLQQNLAQSRNINDGYVS